MEATAHGWALGWLDGTAGRSLNDHHPFHEDAKPGDLTGQLGTRRFNSSKKFRTRTYLGPAAFTTASCW